MITDQTIINNVNKVIDAIKKHKNWFDMRNFTRKRTIEGEGL